MADISKITILNGTTYDIKDPSKVNKTGDIMTGNLIVPATRIANTYYGISFGRTTATPVETILYSGIKWKSSSHMPVVHITGYAYGLSSPVEFKIGFYIYADKIGYCGVTNMGSWNPQVFLFKYTNTDNIDCVAIGLKGSCYFLQLQADVQDEMGKFNNVITDSVKWSWSFLTTTGTIPQPDGGTSCIEVPYKADILNSKKVNGYTVNSSVPSNAKFTDTTYESKAAASGGTAVSLVTTGEKYTWNNKQAALVSGTNIKTINGSSLLGSGNLTVSGLPTVTTSDNGKFLQVVNGAWAAATIPSANGGSF